MAFKLRLGEPLARGIARAHASQAAKALEAARDLGDPQAAAHAARRRFKKIRALLRLLRPACPGASAEGNRFYRELGRRLAPIRDAAALRETLCRLRESAASELSPAAARELERACDRLGQARGESDEDTLRAVVAALSDPTFQLRPKDLKPLRPGDVADGVARSYRAARRALRRCRSPDADAPAFHELRKRAKDLRYQSRLLRSLWPEMIDAYCSELSALTRLLGEAHDLAALAEALAAARAPNPGSRAEKAVGVALRARQDDLNLQAMPLAEKLFAEKPKRLRARLLACWQAERSQGASGG